MEEIRAAPGGRGRGRRARRGADRVESRLPIGEIQTRLRRGRSLKDVAKDAGVEQEWVERFAAPVFAEQAEVISRVQGTFYKRPGWARPGCGSATPCAATWPSGAW